MFRGLGWSRVAETIVGLSPLYSEAKPALRVNKPSLLRLSRPIICSAICNGPNSVLQLSDDDSTSITKLEERKGKTGEWLPRRSGLSPTRWRC